MPCFPRRLNSRSDGSEGVRTKFDIIVICTNVVTLPHSQTVSEQDRLSPDTAVGRGVFHYLKRRGVVLFGDRLQRTSGSVSGS